MIPVSIHKNMHPCNASIIACMIRTLYHLLKSSCPAFISALSLIPGKEYEEPGEAHPCARVSGGSSLKKPEQPPRLSFRGMQEAGSTRCPVHEVGADVGDAAECPDHLCQAPAVLLDL